ncbi:MAG: alpha/beta fold hydrolase [Xanthomonadales bacterium]|nr:alpha/beta fold hydrolase [Xanthomonadales bacterium]
MTPYRPPESLYPFTSRWLQRPAGRMHYLDEGPPGAPVVLMLHGNPTWSFYYRDLIVRLREEFRCIVPDHMGCGLSDKPPDEQYRYTLDSRINDLQALYEYVGAPDRVNLVVHDWGGMIGFGWAVRHGIALDRMAVLNTAAFPMPQSKRFPFLLWLAGRTPLGAFLVRRFNAFSGLAARIAFKKPVSAEVRACYTAPYDSPPNRIATLRFVQDIPLRPGDSGFDIVCRTADGLSRYAERPALLGWGMQDFVFDHHFLEAWKGHLPGARVREYTDCGHYVLEDAGSALREEIAGLFGEASSEPTP